MNKPLMHFKPKLRPGRMTPHGAKFTFKIEDPLQEITLPMIMADFVLLCSGQYRMNEIVEKIYRKQGAVPFRAILETLYTLHSRGFLENSSELDEQAWLQKQQLVKRRVYFDLRFPVRLMGPRPTPVLFYLFSLGILVAGLFQIIAEWQQPFTITRAPQLIECLKFFVLNSCLLTAKHLIRGFQVLNLKGWAGDLSIRFAPWGVYFRVADNVGDYTQEQPFLFLFFLAQILSPFAVLMGAAAVSDTYTSSLFFLATLSTFWELNPFRKTDFYNLLSAIFLPEHLDSLTFIGTGINPRKQRFIFACAAFGLLWLGASLRLLETIAANASASHTLSLSQGSTSEKIAAGIGLAFWFGSLFFIVHAFVETASAVMTEQTRVWRSRFMRRFQNAPEAYTNTQILEKLRHLPLFTHLNDEGLDKLIGSSSLVWIDPGVNVIVAGEQSTDLFVLFEGRVAIERGNKSSPILPVTIFGESALLATGTRMANVVSKEKSLCLRVPIASIRKVARESHVLGEIDSFMTAIMVDQFFASSPLFRKLPREGIDFLSSRGVLEYVTPQQLIFRQGDPGDYFYMVIRGSVQVIFDGQPVKVITQGGFFGEISLIANIPRTATIEANEPAVLFKISADAFWEVMLQHFEMAIFIETVGEQRLQEDLQLMQTHKAG